MRRVILGMLTASLLGCASTADREATRKAWDAHDVERARECRSGAAITGTCIGGGGP
jgi:hypothetical protein